MKFLVQKLCSYLLQREKFNSEIKTNSNILSNTLLASITKP